MGERRCRLLIPKNRKEVSEMQKEREGECAVCKGRIVEDIEMEFVGDGLPVDGPDWKKEYANISGGLYCSNCGLRYEFVTTDHGPIKKSEPSPVP